MNGTRAGGGRKDENPEEPEQEPPSIPEEVFDP